MKKLFLFSILFVLLIPLLVSAKIGVGLGTGKIQLDEPVKPGGIYSLPPLVIYNTGDEPTYYSTGLGFHVDYPQLRPEKNWFNFSPNKVLIEPGQTAIVTFSLNVPLKATPGDYFAFVEAFPVADENVVGTSIGVAAATKLFFTVMPSNFFQATLFKISSLTRTYSPWSYIIFIVIIIALIVTFIKKHFSFQIAVGKKK